MWPVDKLALRYPKMTGGTAFVFAVLGGGAILWTLFRTDAPVPAMVGWLGVLDFGWPEIDLGELASWALGTLLIGVAGWILFELRHQRTGLPVRVEPESGAGMATLTPTTPSHRAAVAVPKASTLPTEQRESVEILRQLFSIAQEAAEVAEAILYRLVRNEIQGNRPNHYLGLFVQKVILEEEKSSRSKLINLLEKGESKEECEQQFGLFYLDYLKVRGWIKRLGELPEDEREWNYKDTEQYTDWWHRDLVFQQRLKEAVPRSDLEILRRFFVDNGWEPTMPPPKRVPK